MYSSATLEGFQVPNEVFLSSLEMICDWRFITDEEYTILHARKFPTDKSNVLPINLIGKPLEAFLPACAANNVMEILKHSPSKKNPTPNTVYTDSLMDLFQIVSQELESSDFKGFSVTIKKIPQKTIDDIRRELFGDSLLTVMDDVTIQLKQQELIANLSFEIAKISDEKLDELFQYILKEIGNFIGARRCFLFKHDQGKMTYSVLHEWDAPGVPNLSKDMQDIPYTDYDTEFGEYYEQLTTRPYIIVDNTFQYDGNIYKLHRDSGIHAFADLPIICDGEFWGFLGVGYGEKPHKWKQGECHMLQSICSIMSTKLESSEHLKKMKQANKAKSDFLSQMSHEIRTPMNAIIGMTELAKTSKEPDRILYCLDKVNDASQHLLSIINDILDMSKIEYGKLELYNEDFLLETVLQRVSTITYFKAEQKKQEFIIKVDSDVPESIVTDSQRLTQVINNLLSNAVKFTPEGGKIGLYIHKVAGNSESVKLLFEVVDNGVGISEKAKGYLFQSFQQADNTITRRFEGTGLGLAISKNIVESMNGEISFESEEGKGSNFYFNITIPVGKTKLESILGDEVDWEKVNIMVVDDDTDVIEYFGDITESIDLTCTTAQSADEALDFLDVNSGYQIIFIDWKMPEMDGIELAKQIRVNYSEKIIIIIMLSEYEWEIVKDEAISVGINNFIVKPFVPSIIIDNLNIMLSRDKSLAKPIDPSRNDDIFANKYILAAEDILINREILKAMLQSTGVTIDFAENGKLAVEMFNEDPRRYDMILMDIHMPEMDGYEATRQIRNSKPFNSTKIPIVAMTANVFKEDVDKCLESGMNDHMGKPIDMDEMIITLRKYLLS